MPLSCLVLLVAVIGCKAAGDKSAPPPPAPAAVTPVALSPIDEAATLGTIEAWDIAAAKLDATVAACATPTAACRQAARDAVTAHGQALKLEFASGPGSPLTPLPLPARVTALVAACDAYAKHAETEDPEVPELIAARQQASYGWFALAIPRYEEILREHRDSDAAGLAEVAGVGCVVAAI